MAHLRPGSPSEVGVSAEKLEQAAELLKREVESKRLEAGAVLVARRGRVILHKGFGRLSAQRGAPALQSDSVFILGSIAKPVTATAVMLLVERGLVALDDCATLHLPEFKGGERNRVRVRDLLRHTSGLPDMLPENAELRRRHAPLPEFLEHTYRTPLHFPPGTQFRYQSMGILLAAAIVEKLTGKPMPDFVRAEIFGPLRMNQTSFGLGGREIGDTVQCALAPGGDVADDERFGPNTSYWRNIAAPWGCMHSNTSDLALLMQAFLQGGTHAGKRICSPATVRAMISDQNVELGAPWGLGWALGRSKAWNVFGDLLPPETFGHTGAPGTLVWADPTAEVLCVILTNRPYIADDGRFLRLVSNAVAASVISETRPDRRNLPGLGEE